MQLGDVIINEEMIPVDPFLTVGSEGVVIQLNRLCHMNARRNLAGLLTSTAADQHLFSASIRVSC